MKRPDAVNRVTLGLLGVVFLAAGAYGLARSYGAFGSAPARSPFLVDNVRSFVGRNHDWFWPCALVVALAAAYLGFVLLRAQLRPGRRVDPLHDRDGDDDVVVAPSVVADAVANDLERDPMVSHARADFTHSGDAPEIDLDLTVPDDVSVNDLRRRIEFEAMENARSALESTAIRAHVVLRLAEPAGRRLR